MTTGQPVVMDIQRRLPASLELTFTALVIALTFAMPLGIFAALRPGLDRRPRRAPALHARRLRADLRVGPAADLRLLLPARAGRPTRPARIDIFASPPPDITGFY